MLAVVTHACKFNNLEEDPCRSEARQVYIGSPNLGHLYWEALLKKIKK